MEEIAAPIWLRRAALVMLPPDMRDAIAGDLEEVYGPTWRCAMHMLLVVPFALAGRVRRNLFLPTVLAQTALVWLLCGAMLTGLVLAMLVLFAAYRADGAPSEKRVVAEACAIAYAATILIQAVTLATPQDWLPLTQQRLAGLQLFFLAPFLLPVFCLFGAVVVSRRGEAPDVPVMQTYRQARLCAARRDLLGAAGLLLVLIPLWLDRPLSQITALLTLANGGAAIWLLVGWREAQVPRDADRMRGQYANLLLRQYRLRGLVWWLWGLPLTVSLQGWFGSRGGVMAMVGTTVAPLLLCYILLAVSREEAGVLRDRMARLRVAGVSY